MTNCRIRSGNMFRVMNKGDLKEGKLLGFEFSGLPNPGKIKRFMVSCVCGQTIKNENESEFGDLFICEKCGKHLKLILDDEFIIRVKVDK